MLLYVQVMKTKRHNEPEERIPQPSSRSVKQSTQA